MLYESLIMGVLFSISVFAGKSEEDVIAALLALEEAEIAGIGDCMGGCPMISPKLQDFVRKG